MAASSDRRTCPGPTTFGVAAWIALVVAVGLLAGCPPPPATTDEEGTYLVASNRLWGDEADFDIRDTAVYPEAAREGLQNPSIGVSDQELTMNRCVWCHECGFKDAFDWEHYGSAEWSPRYTGEDWAPVVQRMMIKENSFLQEEQIARRVYEYLRDDTLGVYDLEADPEGAIVVEVDELPGQGEDAEQAAEDEPGGDAPDESPEEGGAAEPPSAD